MNLFRRLMQITDEDRHAGRAISALTNPVISRTLVLISRKNAQLSPAARALYDMIRGKANSAGWA
jgi:DNA-binding transcriptional LysR family regulator